MQAVAQSIDHLQTERQNDILVYHLANGSRLIVRPSGTEPKVKFYLDAKGSSEADAQNVLQAFDAAVREMLRQDVYGKQNC